jgi:hypothetical protein
MADDIADLIDRLGQVALECRGLIGEAHQAIQDLRRVKREAEDVVATLVAPLIEAKIAAEVKRGLDAYIETQRVAIDKSTAAVFDRFETLANVMMGKGKPDDFEMLARRKLATRKALPNGREALP